MDVYCGRGMNKAIDFESFRILGGDCESIVVLLYGSRRLYERLHVVAMRRRDHGRQ